MAKTSCFATLLFGRRKKHRKVADDTKVGCNECPKVKPVAAADTVPPVAAHKGGDLFGEKASMKGELESHAAKKSVRSHDGGAEKGASPEQDTALSPRLKRSCSNIETKRRGPRADATPARSLSYGDLTRDPPEEEASSASAKTSRSADRVTLKRRSSSQVLPSRSRKLWRRLFLWSHPDRHGRYACDTHEAEGREVVVVDDGSPPPDPNQWVAFRADNSSLLDRVGAWVSSIENEPFHVPDDADTTVPPRVFEVGEPSSGKGRFGGKFKSGAAADEVVQARSAAFSSVAHISGMGLKAMPVLAPFSSLRAVNLSGNCIVHIAPGSLPKGLHSLDLSRNKIATVEGLRDLTKLRVLNLSYNRISRIGHGLSNCTVIRELYLAGNKMSDVEGLHRLLKLAVLDLSFNKITTSKALGQLVANYHSLLALNLLGNPVQANVGDDALRRAVTGLLPSLAYLNKQPVKPQRDVPTDSVVARAALGGGRSQCSRRASRRIASGSGDRSGGRSRSKSRARAR